MKQGCNIDIHIREVERFVATQLEIGCGFFPNQEMVKTQTQYYKCSSCSRTTHLTRNASQISILPIKAKAG